MLVDSKDAMKAVPTLEESKLRNTLHIFLSMAESRRATAMTLASALMRLRTFKKLRRGRVGRG